MSSTIAIVEDKIQSLVRRPPPFHNRNVLYMFYESLIAVATVNTSCLVHGREFGSKEGEIGHRRGYFPASISSMSFLSSVFTNELSETPRAEARSDR